MSHIGDHEIIKCMNCKDIHSTRDLNWAGQCPKCNSLSYSDVLALEYETEVFRRKASYWELAGAKIGPELILEAYKDAISPFQFLSGLSRKILSQ